MYYRNPQLLFGAGLDPIVIAWLAQLTTSFGSNPSVSFITALNIMIKSLRSTGDILQMDRFWIFAQEVQGYSRVSIVNPSSAQITEVNTPTWTANQGYSGNGTTQYLNTNFIPSADGINYAQDSASFGFYCRTNNTATSIEIGAENTVSLRRLYVFSKYTDNNSYFQINSDTEKSAAMPRSDSLISLVRTSSAAIDLYRVGAIVSGAIASTSTGSPDIQVYLAARSTNGTAGSFSTRQLSMAYFGSKTISQSNLYTFFQTFATSRAFNV